MVNIAGRSKGCSTCRRRRVKCDENKPICNRCRKCDYKCSGARDLVFLDMQNKILSPESPPVPVMLALKGFEAQTYIGFTRGFLLRGGIVDHALQDLHYSDVDAIVADGHGELLPSAILSLSSIFFGSEHKEQRVMNYGYRIYGNTLRQLNDALSVPEISTQDDVLISVVAFVLLETFAPTGRGNYVKHVLGLEKLLELRGTAMLISPKALQIHRAVRCMVILASLLTKKPSTLARVEWKVLPWFGTSERKTGEDYICEILAECTVILGHLQNSPDGDERSKLLRDTLELSDRLRSWKKHYGENTQFYEAASRASSLISAFSPASVKAQVTSTSPPIPVHCNCALINWMLYNATLIQILDLLAALRFTARIELISSTPESACRSSHDGYAAAKFSASQEICQYLPYITFWKDKMDVGSLTAAQLALQIAWINLGGNSSEEGRQISRSQRKREHARGLWVDVV